MRIAGLLMHSASLNFTITDLVLRLLKGLVCAEYRIPEWEKASVVADVDGVVEVMILGRAREWDQAVGAPGEVVSAVSVKVLSEADDVPGNYGHQVAFVP